MRDEWHISEEGRANSSPAFLALEKEIAEIVARAHLGDNPLTPARSILARLTHGHGMVPKGLERRTVHPGWVPGKFDLSDLPEDAPKDLLGLIAKCKERAADIRLDATALPVNDLYFQVKRDGLQLIVEIRVPDRNKTDALEWIMVWRTVICPWAPLATNGPDYLVYFARETIKNVLAHEVDESLTLEGVRVFDPHRPLGTRVPPVKT